MKIAIINGSPRPTANTSKALKLIKEGIEKNIPEAAAEIISAYKHNIKACIHCDSCRNNGGDCVLPDDSVPLMNKLLEADVIIFGSPVYWWGITAQIKLCLDKLYSKGEVLPKSNKKIGLFTCGEAPLNESQYRIIDEQFKCICDYLNWDFSFSLSACTPEKDSLEKDKDKQKELSEIWTKLK